MHISFIERYNMLSNSHDLNCQSETWKIYLSKQFGNFYSMASLASSASGHRIIELPDASLDGTSRGHSDRVHSLKAAYFHSAIQQIEGYWSSASENIWGEVFQLFNR